jgi:hypothetical protein
VKRASVIRREILYKSQCSPIVARYCTYSLEKITDTDTAYSVQDWIARAVGWFMARRYSCAMIKCMLVDRYYDNMSIRTGRMLPMQIMVAIACLRFE